MCQEPTEFLLIGCLTESHTPDRRHFEKKGHFIRDEWNNHLCLFNISHFSFLCCAKKSSLISCITERINQRKTVLWRNPGQRRWTWPVLLLQVLHLWTVRMRREAWGYSKLQVDRLDYQGGLMQTQIKIPTPTQRRVLKDGKEMLNCSSAQGKPWQWWRIRTPRMFRKILNSRRFRRFKT